MAPPRVQNRPDLPVSRNPWVYMPPGSKLTVDLKPPPPNFSERGLRRAELLVPRPQSAVKNLSVPSEYPMKLIGVAPADAVTVKEVGTRPSSALRAFVSHRSDGAILYSSYTPATGKKRG